MSSSSRTRNGKSSGRGTNDGQRNADGAAEQKFHQHGKSVTKTAVNFETVKKVLLLKFPQEFKMGVYISEGVREMRDPTIPPPIRQRSVDTDKDVSQMENESFDVIFAEEAKVYATEKRQLSVDMRAAGAKIFLDYCTRGLQDKLESENDFDKVLRDDPLKLLDRIRVLMHEPDKAKEPLTSLLDATANFVNIRQMEGESINDYVRRFKNMRTIFKGLIGSKFLDGYADNLPEYKTITDTKLQVDFKTSMFRRFETRNFVRTLDRKKYGSLIDTWRSRYSQGFDEYPDSLEDAITIFGSHKLDDYKQPKAKKSGEAESTSNTSFQQSANKSGFKKRETKCFVCGSKEHTVPKCPEKNSRTRDKWDNKEMGKKWVDRKVTNHQRSSDRDNESIVSDSDVSTISQSSVRSTVYEMQHCQLSLHEKLSLHSSNHSSEFKARLKKVILFDNCSTISIGCNDDLYYNKRTVDDGIVMKTNTGSKPVNEMVNGNVPFDIWFSKENGIANIYAMYDMLKFYFVEYDGKQNAFICIPRDGRGPTLRFEANKEGLYEYEPTEAYKKFIKQQSKKCAAGTKHSTTSQSARLWENYLSRFCGVETVAENKEGFTPVQISRAKAARKLYNIVGASGAENLKKLLRQRLIKNCPVTHEDVDLAEKIWGKNVSSMKGHTTRKQPPPVVEDLLEIPPELLENNRQVVLFIDTMFINKVPVLAAIDGIIRFRSAYCLSDQTADEYLKAIRSIARIYNKGGVRLKRIDCDPEFEAVMKKVQTEFNVNYEEDIETEQQDFEINPGATQAHVPRAERNIRTIKDRVRAYLHRLPYKAVPKIMIQQLVLHVVKMLNVFPVKGGISPYYSPQAILTHENIDFNKHCKFEPGAYVQASQVNKRTNSMHARTVDAIYLRAVPNNQSSHLLMDLQSGELIRRQDLVELPLTDKIIARVEALAKREGFKSVKFFNRKNEEFLNSDSDLQLEGVSEDLEDDLQVEEPDETIGLKTGKVIPNPDEEVTTTNIDDDIAIDDDDDPPELVPVVSDDDDSDSESESEDTEVATEPTEAATINEEEEWIPVVRRSGRTKEPVERLDPRWEGKSYSCAQRTTNPRSAKKQSTKIVKDPDKKNVRSTKSNKKKLKKTMDDRVYQEKPNKKVTFADMVKKKVPTSLEMSHNILTQGLDRERVFEYDEISSVLTARFINEIQNKVDKHGACFAQQYMIKKGLKVFGEKGKTAASKELDQLHQRNCFAPKHVKDMSDSERRKAQEALMFLTEKRDKSIKGRMVYNGKPTREWLDKDDAASPTAMLESILLTATIDAFEHRDVMTADVPNAFIQAHMPKVKDGEEQVYMKISGSLVDMLVELAPETYSDYVVFENGRKILYVVVLRAIYGMLQAALLWYKKFRKDLESIGFKFNNYDPCVCNRKMNGKQHSVRFHVDDLMSSHVNRKVNDKFAEWLNRNYGSHGEVKANRGKIHDFLGMTFDFTTKDEVKVRMEDYVERMINEFPLTLKTTDTELAPANKHLFEAGHGKKLDKGKSEIFHTTVARGLFAAKRARPDILQVISVLCTRVRDPYESDWTKLVRMMHYLNGTRSLALTLRADNLKVVKWFIDASFAVHPDFKSHSGCVMTLGAGAIQAASKKQQLNTRSSTESEVVGVDDMITQVLWTKLFLLDQGYEVEKNIIYQDNKSSILLETNGRRSAGKRSRAMNVRYYFVADQVAKGNVEVAYCPTGDMIADFMTKPLQGSLFRKFRKEIMGM